MDLKRSWLEFHIVLTYGCYSIVVKNSNNNNNNIVFSVRLTNACEHILAQCTWEAQWLLQYWQISQLELLLSLFDILCSYEPRQGSDMMLLYLSVCWLNQLFLS